MIYRIARNYQEYLDICKELYTTAVGGDKTSHFIPFDDLQDWEQFFDVTLPYDEENDIFLPLADYTGEVGHKPEEAEYPVLVIHMFDVMEDFRNGDTHIRLFEWKSLDELTLKVDEEKLASLSHIEPIAEGYQEPEDSFIPFEKVTGLSNLNKDYADLEKLFRRLFGSVRLEFKNEEAEEEYHNLYHTLFRMNPFDFIPNKTVSYLVPVLDTVSLKVTVSHLGKEFGKTDKTLWIEGIIVKEQTTEENIEHFFKLIDFTGVVTHVANNHLEESTADET